MKSGGGSCDCDCTPTGGSCAGDVVTRSGAACGNGPVALAVMSGQCTELVATLPLPVAVLLQVNVTAPSGCTATVLDELAAPTRVPICTGANATMDAACGTGELCVPKPTIFTGGLACIVHDGDVGCPAKLALRTVLGSNVQDDRSCSATCSCAPAGCKGGTLEAFSKTACTTSVRKVPVDGSCTSAGTALTGASYRYTAATGCEVSTPPKVIGAEVVTAPRTLCCALEL